jgi:hypothetical protein
MRTTLDGPAIRAQVAAEADERKAMTAAQLAEWKAKDDAARAQAAAVRQADEQVRQAKLEQTREQTREEKKAAFRRQYVLAGGKADQVDKAWEQFLVQQASAATIATHPKVRL